MRYADPDVTDAVVRRIQLGSMCTLNSPEEYELARLLVVIAVQLLVGTGLEESLEPAPALRVQVGLAEDRVRERAQKEAGPTHEQRKPAPVTDLVDPVPGESTELTRVEANVGGDDVQSEVRDSRLLLRCGFGRPDVHPSVDLPGIHRDDLGLEARRNLDAERGLAGGGGPEEADQGAGGF
jgi:hypothetical protein